MTDSLFCEICSVRGYSQVSFDQHLASQRHHNRINKGSKKQSRGRKQLLCSFCNYTTETRDELTKHRRSDQHRERLFDRRADATLRHLGPLYERAQLLLLHADPPIDLKAGNVKIGSLSRVLKDLGLGFACITCLMEGKSASKIRHHLLKQREHIYPLEAIEEEEARVLQKLEERAQGPVDAALIEQVTLVFIVKKALLIKVFL